jgi:short-subunit dehydrogenase
MKIDGSCVVLTGAAGGIGAPTALALARAGARLVLVGRRAEALEALARAIERDAGARARCTPVAADLTSAAGIEAVRRAGEAGGANVLINNAGLPGFGALLEHEPGDIERVITTNLLAPMLLTRALLPQLRSAAEASVLNVGSVLGRLGLPGYSVYSASKFGLRGFSEALRRELADTAVRVQYLGPRTVATAFNGAEAQAYNRATATGSDAPERVAHAVVQMLESGRAERFLGFPETLAVRVNGALPGALDGAFAKHRRALAAS